MDIARLEREMLGDLWVSTDLWENLSYLCDACNGRFAGTEDEHRAGDFIMSRLRSYGLANVAAEPFEMRGWDRGPALLTLLNGERPIELPCIGLPGTQGCELETEIIDVGPGTVADFQRLGSAVSGKIVLTSSDGPGRGEKYRAAHEAGAAAFIFTHGAPGMLIPTGSIGKDLPAIGLSFEHAARIRRILAVGPVSARLSITAQVHTVTARNIVAEIPGTDSEAGWILAGGHYDGHDIAQGAHDNAAAIAVLMEAARLLSPLQGQLKMGIRFVMFSGEELGLFGSYAYARDHASQLDPIRLVFNVDVVAMAMPLVLQTQASPELASFFRSLPLQDLDATVRDGPGSFIMNSDHFPFSLAGLLGVWALTSHPASNVGWGHTTADTLDKVEPRLLRQTAASVVRVLLRMCAEPDSLPRLRRTPEEMQKVLIDAGFEKALRADGRWPF
jgi:aminopeptidase YwaD